MTKKDKEKLGCLIIHGFAGGIHQIKAAEEYLSNKGYITSCPLLKGHTGNPKDMKEADYKDWIASAEKDLIHLMEKTDRILIIGFSMGGLIAINLGCKYDIEAIVTINTPIYYWNPKNILLNIYKDIKIKRPHHIKRYIQAKKASPIISMINFLRLLNRTKARLSNIQCPFLIIQTRDDDTTRFKSANYIYEKISSKDKTLKLYEKGGHHILDSDYKDKVMQDVEEFIGKI